MLGVVAKLFFIFLSSPTSSRQRMVWQSGLPSTHSVLSLLLLARTSHKSCGKEKIEKRCDVGDQVSTTKTYKSKGQLLYFDCIPPGAAASCGAC